MRLHVIKSFEGDCLLLESSESAARVLIDGGPATTYETYLAPYLKQLGAPISLDAVIVSHVDRDHITGILDLLADVRAAQADRSPQLVHIAELWHNSFQDLIGSDEVMAGMAGLIANAGVAGISMADLPLAFYGISEGEKLRRAAKLLDIPLNASMNGESICPDTLPDPHFSFGALKLQVVGPTKANLEALRAQWLAWLAKNRAAAKPEQLANADQSVPNLSSIVLIAEEDGKRILLTGDARGDHIEQGLKQADLFNGETCHFDVLKVQHHGSDRNAVSRFYSRVTADTYVISANGKNGNPDVATLQWIADAAHEAGRSIRIFVTHPSTTVDEFIASRPPGEFGYDLRIPTDDEHAIVIDLAQN